MPSDAIYAPWRMDYIKGLDKGSSSCFICDGVAAAATVAGAPGGAGSEACRERLVLWTTPHSIVIINRYPYTNGHLLVAPKAHKAELEELTDEELLDLQKQTARAVKLLQRTMSPQGFNIGINLGRCAGAGLPGHLHQHVVPRWNGDTNFMWIIGEVRVVPQAMTRLYDELARGVEGI